MGMLWRLAYLESLCVARPTSEVSSLLFTVCFQIKTQDEESKSSFMFKINQFVICRGGGHQGKMRFRYRDIPLLESPPISTPAQGKKSMLVCVIDRATALRAGAGPE